jgi:glycine betaine/choline ABC-type transport system substrate-binding protein
VVSQKLMNGKTGKEIAKISNQVSALLTISAMRAMDKAAYVQKAKPSEIASKFLKANGLK